MTTLKDVAKKANVSQMTVSRVINHPEAVSDELKGLVFSAMQELNYRPNAVAKALANNRTQVIKVLILENIADAEPYYMQVLAGISQVLAHQQYSLLLPPKFEDNFDDCDGVIVMGAKRSDQKQLQQIAKPVVLFGENPLFDYVDTDNFANIYRATTYAHKCGYEHLYYIGLDYPEPFAKKRQAGYEQALLDLKATPHIFTIPGHQEHVLDFVKTLPLQKNSAFICATDRIALEVSEILATRGQIPDEFGVIGHDGILLDKILFHHLTTMKQDFELMGKHLAEILLAKILTKPATPSQLFSAELIARQTTRPIK